jgi:hypothetical protein
MRHMDVEATRPPAEIQAAQCELSRDDAPQLAA